VAFRIGIEQSILEVGFNECHRLSSHVHLLLLQCSRKVQKNKHKIEIIKNYKCQFILWQL
jgi:hypothetical protein